MLIGVGGGTVARDFYDADLVLMILKELAECDFNHGSFVRRGRTCSPGHNRTSILSQRELRGEKLFFFNQG